MWLQNPDYSAQLDRQLVQTLVGSREQIVEGLVVTQHSTGNLSVDVSEGRCLVQGDDQTDQGIYVVVVDADTNLVMPAAPGSNKRIDLVVVQVNDVQAGGAAGDNAVLAVVQGTSSATPVAPTVPASAIVLAQVLRTAGDAAVLTSMITDVGVRGAWPYTVSTAAVPSSLPPNHLYVRVA
jgi:hypothetical protein